MKKLLLTMLGALIALHTLARDFTYTYEGQTIIYEIIDEDAKTCQTKGYDYSHWATINKVSGNLSLPSNPKDRDTEFTLVSISGGTFRENSGLTSVIIPNSVTTIGSYAFYKCSGLTSVTIPNSVTEINACAFEGCISLTSAIIPNSITKIRYQTFYECSGLTSVIIPNSVTEIEDWAFCGCNNLTSVNISEYVSIIGRGPFSLCSSLKEINVAAGNSNYTSIDGVLYSKDASRLIQYTAGKEDTKFIIPNSVTEIGWNAFCGSTTLSSVAIPNSVTTIGIGAFTGCSGLTSVTIPNFVNEIVERTFYGCNGLTSVTIPYSVTVIGNEAFLGCSGLTSITIPSSVTKIGDYAFQYCSGLTSVIYLAKEPIVGSGRIFDEETYQKATLNYLKSAEEKIASTKPWYLFVNRNGLDEDPEGAISEVQATDGGATAVYDMRGIKVGTSTSDLQRGIYIANGRKIFVR